VDQKRADALTMLRTMRERLAANPGRKEVAFMLEHTAFWDDAMRSAGEVDPDMDQDSDGTDLTSVLDELRLEADGCARVYERAMLRHLALHEAQGAGVVATDGDAADAADRFRRARGLAGPDDLRDWLAEQRITGARFDELMREESLVQRVRRRLTPSVEVALLDCLRLEGEYGRLLARARQKDRLLREHGLQNPGLEAAGLTVRTLLKWYFESLGQPVPAAIAEYARGAGFGDHHAFLRAVLREYCYVRLQEPVSQSGPPCLPGQARKPGPS
jgi:hypothetical protein